MKGAFLMKTRQVATMKTTVVFMATTALGSVGMLFLLGYLSTFFFR